jgi:hypothetical protein
MDADPDFRSRSTSQKSYQALWCTKAEVQAAALTYLGTGNHGDQDSDMVINCLRKLVANKVFDQVAERSPKPDPLEDGPSFLIAIIDHMYTNMLSNTTVAHENLSLPPEYMESLPDSNITELNSYMKKQLEVRAAEGEMTNDLVINL